MWLSFTAAQEFTEKIGARLLEMAKSDPDLHVRGECWETLGEISNEVEIRRAHASRLADKGTSVEEKGGAAVALAHQTDNAAVFQAIENLYADPRGRAKALKAMGQIIRQALCERTRRGTWMIPITEIKRQAIWAVRLSEFAGGSAAPHGVLRR